MYAIGVKMGVITEVARQGQYSGLLVLNLLLYEL